MLRLLLFSTVLLFAFAKTSSAQSVARTWNEELLEAIRGDFARPTVHARNLYHTSIALYDGWAVYDDEADTHFLGKTLGGFTCPLEPFPMPSNIEEARKEVMSYAAYRVLRYRFRQSPSRAITWFRLDSIMNELGYNSRYTGSNYQSGQPADLGNYLGSQLIIYGNTDNANDAADYANQYYQPFNPPLIIDESGNPNIIDPNRWQPLSLSNFIDQSGNPIPGGMQDFLGPEWGNVVPFALSSDDATVYTRDTSNYIVYHDPGPPFYITDPATREDYQRNFEMVAIWSGLLDPADNQFIDISPGAIGRHADPLPMPDGYFDYYNEYGGGDSTGGLRQNPITGEPYAPNVVKRGDYARVLAEFWADGPDSETPPGHWFALLNYVMDQPQFTRQWRGQGPLLDTLEYQVKAYLTLGGAMHDAAIATWGIKGWYDYLRPVSAIRYMAEKGQRSDPNLPRYHEHGLRLEPGFIEQIDNISDPLAGPTGENVGEIKLWAWLGPEAIADPDTDVAGVGWILAKEWWPYQRPTFVSPPFAGYVSGHSTYSRAAAELLTAMTGSAYFPGGIGTFTAPKNEFLVFEEGPSETIELQWGTYRDASDEVSLSRIFGGIHPPTDDIPGRRIGIVVAEDAFRLANQRFDTVAPVLLAATTSASPILYDNLGEQITTRLRFSEALDTTAVYQASIIGGTLSASVLRFEWVSNTEVDVVIQLGDEEINQASFEAAAFQLVDLYGNTFTADPAWTISGDTKRPTALVSGNDLVLTPADTGAAALVVTFDFDERMDTAAAFVWTLPTDFPANVLSVAQQGWTSTMSYEVTFDVAYRAVNYQDVQFGLLAKDSIGNSLSSFRSNAVFSLDLNNSSVRQLQGAVVDVYPNPVSDQLFVTMTQPREVDVVLRDAAGRELMRDVLMTSGSFDVSTLPGGNYTLTLRTQGGEMASWQLVVE